MNNSTTKGRLFKWICITLVGSWLVLFAFIPHLFILLKSFQAPVYMGEQSPTLANYKALIFNPMYFRVFWRSFKLASICTVLCLILAYPFAWFLSQITTRYKHLLLLLVIIPFWTSSLIRTYAIIALLKVKGILNTLLLSLGVIQQPLQWLYTNTAVLIGLTYDLLPFMILPLYTNFEKLDSQYLHAARDLGASQWQVFSRVLLPLTVLGILGGSLLVFLPAMSLFYIADMLGGAKSLLLGNLIQRQFLSLHNWPMGAALSIILVSALGLLLGIYRLAQKQGKLFYQDISR
jgi:spermidine/putrescine transport system permease protein